MNDDLTSNPNAAQLDEVEVLGHTVFVSTESEKAYVEFHDDLVSMTNLRAWNHLMEQAKVEAIDGYSQEQSLEEKELERQRDSLAETLAETARELQHEADKLRRQ